jgi:hypothetical protein
VNQNIDYYQTQSLCLATTLSLWLPIESIDRSDPNRAAFVFKKTDELIQLIELYHSRQLQVEPQAYFNQMRVVKTRLYEKE